MSEQATVLIVDDDQEICSLLGEFLTQFNFTTLFAHDGEAMFENLQNHTVDLIILDVLLPGDDGFTLCRKLRADSQIPIIMLTAIGEETDRIIGLEIGADDYLPKPFNPRELLARIRAILRRVTEEGQTGGQGQAAHDSGILSFAGWKLDTNSRRLLSPDDVEISVSAGEYDLLHALVEHPQRVLSRDQLLDMTKNRPAGPFDRSIDVQISRLRYKIENDPKNPILIKTVRGGGYMLTSEVEACAV